MATKIRLQRHGRKRRAFYHIVVADARAPRDGRFIEKIGTYNPVSNPATIHLDVAKATQWLLAGAEPTDTVKAILSYKGANYKKHLQVGVLKGAITQEQADQKFAAWAAEKEGLIQAKRDGLSAADAQKRADAFKAEVKRKDDIAAKIIAKAAAEEAANAPAVEETTEESTEEGNVDSEATTEEATSEEAPSEETSAE